MILIMCHFYVCFWIYLGDKYFLNDSNAPWLLKNSADFSAYNDRETYVFAFYWIMETITTVGYGDYSGATTAEYLFSMIVEFSGLILTAVLMYSVDRVFQDDSGFDQYIEHKYQALDIWITKVEKST
jgi:undecaprenyl pyrophosphate phosphatase UppP